VKTIVWFSVETEDRCVDLEECVDLPVLLPEGHKMQLDGINFVVQYSYVDINDYSQHVSLKDASQHGSLMSTQRMFQIVRALLDCGFSLESEEHDEGLIPIALMSDIELARHSEEDRSDGN